MSCNQTVERVEDPYDATSSAWDDGTAAGLEGLPDIEEEAEAAEARCCNAVCSLAHISVWLGFLSLLGTVAVLAGDDPASLRLMRVMPLLHVLINVAGLAKLDQKRYERTAHSCLWCPCSYLCIPWCLIAIGLFKLLEGIMMAWSAATEEEHDPDEHRYRQSWMDSVVPCVNALLMIGFGFRWLYQKRYGHQYGAGEASGSSAPGVPSARARFAREMSQEGRKFELVYIVAEAVCIAATASYLLVLHDHEKDEELTTQVRFLKVHLAVAPIGLTMRVYRYSSTVQSGLLMSGFGTVLDVFVFTWNSIAAALTGHTVVTSFIVNVLLTYSVITFFPYWRAAIVVPICYIGYSLAAIHGDEKLNRHELLLLALGLGINLVAKRMIETSKYQSFLLLEERGRQVVDEKVLRCQAEFEKDYALSGPRPKLSSEPSAYCGLRYPEAVQGSAIKSGQTYSELSLHSAPTLLLSPGPKGKPDAKHANCLPADALVWVEGEAQPRKLRSVGPSHRILCYDRLGGSLKHAEVSEVEEIAGPVVWNTVTLTDGTSLKLTADHPVQPVPPATTKHGMYGPMFNASPVESRNLRPGEDSLLVLKVAPVEVLSMDLVEEVGTRIALSVQQPERHAIFVAPAKQAGNCLQSIAVESNAMAGHVPVMAGAHNTFLSFTQACCHEGLQSQSAPPSLCASKPGSIGEVAVAPSEPSVTASQTVSLSSVSGSSISAVSMPGSEVVVGGPSSNAGPQPAPEMRISALSTLLGVKKLGLKSLGSASHGALNCKTCAFENKRQFFFAKPCSKGALCEFCHEPHKELRKQKRQATRAMRRAAWTNECVVGTPTDGGSLPDLEEV